MPASTSAVGGGELPDDLLNGVLDMLDRNDDDNAATKLVGATPSHSRYQDDRNVADEVGM